MLYLFVGMPRNGKTISGVVEIKSFYDAGYTIYSNTPLTFPYTKLTRKMIIEWEKVELNLPPKTAFFIDEIWAWFDSRNSANSNNKVFSYFINQLGKFTENKSLGLTIIGTTQFFMNLDIRGRRVTSKVCECKKIKEVEGEYIEVLRTWKQNRNLELKTVKREKVKFSKEDFNLYDTQANVKSDDEKNNI
jgi:hypothetical protein